jgi:hypothetical protein
VRLLAWNIRQGGGSRLAGIVAALARHDADVLILSEYRGGDSADRLRAALALAGYRHCSELLPPPQRTGVLIAARRGFSTHGVLCMDVPEPHRLVEVDLGAIRLIGVYMPNLLKKVPYWQALLAAFATRVDDDALAIGDFNTCRAFVDEPGAIDATAHFMDRVERSAFAICGGIAIPTGASIRGTAIVATASASIMRSCRQASPIARGWCGIRTTNVWRDCRTIRCCCWICRCDRADASFPRCWPCPQPPATRAEGVVSDVTIQPLRLRAWAAKWARDRDRDRDRATNHHKEASRHEIRAPLLQHRPLR